MARRTLHALNVARPLLAALGIVAVLGAASCTRTLVERSYQTLALGDSKSEVIDKLLTLSSFGSLEPAVRRPANLIPRSREQEAVVVQLAETEPHDGALSAADVEYLQNYDLWYFEEADGGHQVVLEFTNGLLTEIESRRTVPWWEGLL